MFWGIDFAPDAERSSVSPPVRAATSSQQLHRNAFPHGNHSLKHYHVSRRAIISDIHGNLEALEAVLADIDSQDVTAIVCLGDMVGYGPNPCECLDVAEQFSLTLLGNHDQAVLFDPEGFSSGAEKAIFWTRKQLERHDAKPETERRLRFIAELDRTHRENGFQFLHASPRDPINEYVFPEDVYHAAKMESLFSMVEGVCFQGHTHVPGVFTTEPRFLPASELGHGFALRPGAKAMINVGSVGQPRDCDWRASYAILDDGVVRFRRVEYDVRATVDKIHRESELDDFLGDRLLEGR